MATISTLEVDIKPTCFGYEIEDIIAMVQEIRRGGYDPNSPDWNAYKAGYQQGHKVGYLQGRTDATKEINKRLTETLRDYEGRC